MYVLVYIKDDIIKYIFGICKIFNKSVIIYKIYFFIIEESMLMGRGNMMVEFFSAEIELRVCKYRSWSVAGDFAMILAVFFSVLDVFCFFLVVII